VDGRRIVRLAEVLGEVVEPVNGASPVSVTAFFWSGGAGRLVEG
jgi:hypothetical protein